MTPHPRRAPAQPQPRKPPPPLVDWPFVLMALIVATAAAWTIWRFSQVEPLP